MDKNKKEMFPWLKSKKKTGPKKKKVFDEGWRKTLAETDKQGPRRVPPPPPPTFVLKKRKRKESSNKIEDEISLVRNGVKSQFNSRDLKHR